MAEVNPMLKREAREIFERLHKMSLEGIENGLMKYHIEFLLNYHELERTGEWKRANPDIDYSDASFEMFFEDQTSIAIEDYRMQIKAIFEHVEEIMKEGIGVVCRKYYPEEYERIFPNTNKEDR